MAKYFIKKAIKHPGALHKELGVPAGEKIPAGILAKKRATLTKKAAGEKKLSPSELTTLRRINLAKTLKGLRK